MQSETRSRYIGALIGFCCGFGVVFAIVAAGAVLLAGLPAWYVLLALVPLALAVAALITEVICYVAGGE